MDQYALAYYPSILNSSSSQLCSVDVPVSIFGYGVQVHPYKGHPKSAENISIYHPVQTIPQHNNIYCVQKVDCK